MSIFKEVIRGIRLVGPGRPVARPGASPADPDSTYRERAEQFALQKSRLEKVAGYLAASRLILFIAFGTMVYLAVRTKNAAFLPAALAALAGFLLLVKAAAVNRMECGHLDRLCRINEEEMQAIRGDHSAFDPGNPYIDYHHPFSYDLDMFGESSLYRMINRTETPAGRTFLAELLRDPPQDPGRIRDRQDAVRELRDRIDWRQEFQAIARDSAGSAPDRSGVSSWLASENRFHSLFFHLAIPVNAVVTIALTLWFILPYLLPGSVVGGLPVLPASAFLYFIVPLSLVVAKARIISREQEKLENLLNRLRRYGGLLERIEKEPFTAPELIRLQDSLMSDGEPSSLVMKRLADILWGLETRGNLIVSFILNAYLLWDIRVMIRLGRWRSRYGRAFESWIHTIAGFETLNSLANLAFNRPDLTWPLILDGPFRMVMEDAGHPLIPPGRRIDNSLEFSAPNRIFLVTGANMSGKSTLLRMTGVNMVLAMCGGPVCARRMELAPVAVMTSVRTHDSLGDDESYFYAELKKLGAIILRIEAGHPVFVILDEMLKGTNSRDKHAGSAALIRKLIHLGTSGLVATHDVELGELEAEYPGRLVNRCFEVISTGDQLRFDYRLYPGVSKNLNATFLMRQMGII